MNFKLDDIEPGRYFPDGIYLTILNPSSLISSKIFVLDDQNLIIQRALPKVSVTDSDKYGFHKISA